MRWFVILLPMLLQEHLGDFFVMSHLLKKTKNKRKSYAPGFTTLSNLEEDKKGLSDSNDTKAEAKEYPGKKMKPKDPINDSEKPQANKGHKQRLYQPRKALFK